MASKTNRYNAPGFVFWTIEKPFSIVREGLFWGKFYSYNGRG
jgi:hypothetical protein